MTFRERYRRLTIWNKAAFWGSAASILGLLVSLLAFWPSTARVPPPIHLTKVEFHEPRVGQPAAANVHYAVSSGVLQIRGNGTVALLGPRPGIPFEWHRAAEEAWAVAASRWTEAGPELTAPMSQDLYFTSFGPPLARGDIDALLAGSSGLFVAGRIHYVGDAHGALEFCVMLKNQAKILCPNHNGPVAR